MRAKLPALLLGLAVGVLMVAGPAGASAPLTKVEPYRAVCLSQGGTFSVAIDSRSLYCDKEGALFTAFTPGQLDLLRTLCTKHYGAFFGVQGMEGPDGSVATGTFCSTA